MVKPDFGWDNFYGKIGNSQISMSLSFSYKSKNVKGYYFYDNIKKNIELKGEITDDSILTLTETFNNKETGYFKGILRGISPRTYSGEWSDPLKTKSIAFNLQGEDLSSMEGSNRYDLPYGTNKEIEDFMRAVKDAILTDNKNWIGKHMTYPFNIRLNQKLLTLRNVEDLNNQYNAIFTEVYKQKVKAGNIDSLFSNDQGVMLGNGEVWIILTPGSNKNKYSFMIRAINP